MTETATPARDWKYWREPEWVEVDGVATAYRRQGSGATVLYLHGAGLTRQWLPLYEQLSESCELVAPEHPGFGDTTMPDWVRSVDDLVLHYDALIDALGLEHVHLVGHSLGGWIAASLAITYPRRFASLSLITPVGLRVPEAPMADLFRTAPEAKYELLLSGADPDRYREYFELDGDFEDTIQAYSESITLARLLWNPRYDLRLDHRLARIRIPTLVIGADDDRVVPDVHIDHWTDRIPGAEKLTISGAPAEPTGHLLTLQQPRQLAAAIAAHVGG